MALYAGEALVTSHFLAHLILDNAQIAYILKTSEGISLINLVVDIDKKRRFTFSSSPEIRLSSGTRANSTMFVEIMVFMVLAEIGEAAALRHLWTLCLRGLVRE